MSGYPSPQNASSYDNYPPPNNHSPTPSNLSLPSINAMAQQSQHHMGSGLPLPVAQMGAQSQYYHSSNSLPPPQYPNVTSDPNGSLRYQLPVATERQMSGGRHKKEIKRRTKTGCLTCRKRRIKCDEQHPACRNCQKSKRECLGYDPIFKQQPGPAAIQPAPSSAPSSAGLAATANPYGNQPQMLNNYGAPANMAYDPALSAGVSSPGSASQQFDYTSAIDPALEAVVPPATSGSSYQTTTPAKRNVNDLLARGGPAPPRNPTDVTTNLALMDEIKHLYYSIYAPGLENFLESKWFPLKGLTKLLEGKYYLEQFAALLHQFSKANQNDPREIAYTASVEGRVVWALATMVRTALPDANGVKNKTVPPNDDPTEASNRLHVFEALLTGQIAATNPLTAPVPGSTDHHRLRELEFWHTLGNFVTHEYENPAASKEVDETLSALRNLLDGRENRDVLYSIAVVRGLGQRVSEYTDDNTPLHLDESDNKSKLLVAKKFISDEATGNGTTNVIRRLCDLAARSWAPTIPPPAPFKSEVKPEK